MCRVRACTHATIASCPRACVQARTLQCPQQSFRFVPRFFVFLLGRGVGHDAAADGELPPAAAGGDRADQDVQV